MADIVTNTLQIGNNNLILRDADAQEKISDLKEDLDSKIGFGGETQIDMFDPVITTSSSYLANTRRWFVNHIFSAEDTIDTIDYQFWKGSAVQGRIINFEIWEKSANALTKVDTVSVDVSQSVAVSEIGHGTVDIEYTGSTDYMIAVQQEGSPSCLLYQTDTTGADNVLVSTDISKDTTELSYDQLTVFGMKLIPSFTVHYTSKVVGNVVLIGDGQKYAEIQDALNDIADDSETNPYTFLVMPKGTPYKPFSMLRESFSDVYPWNGVTPRWISIIGIDKAHCVIRSDSGDYAFPCAELMTNGVVSDLTFVMTNDSQTQTATQGGYCLHIDCRPLNDIGYKMIIEDCDFENSSGPCVGIGVHADCDLQFRRCHFNTTLSAEYNPHEGYRNLADYGVVYAHTSTATTAPNQNLTLVDCDGVCAEGSKSLRIDRTTQYDPETSSFVYTLLRDVFWNKTLNAAGYAIVGTLTPNPMNFGNNNA